MKNTPTLFGYVFGGKVIGVNSGHRCADGSYRSRGLYVKPQFRGLGLGVALLKATLKQATLEESKFIWSLPRMDSWKTYNSVGFKPASSWHLTETSDNNAYCYKSLQ
ncbi:MAG: GNAT family N-acetyltransferase [Minisyncoccia bacterium]